LSEHEREYCTKLGEEITMIEKEFKVLLSKEKYLELFKRFDWHKSVKQINHYYADNERLLIEEDITVRVREISGTYILQIKSPILEESALHVKDEYEEKLATLPNIIYTDQINRATGLSIGHASYVGSLQTYRKICYWNDTVQMCLDQNDYLSIVDYELEIEYDDEIPYKLLEMLTSYGIFFNDDACGKYLRYMQEHYKSWHPKLGESGGRA